MESSFFPSVSDVALRHKRSLWYSKRNAWYSWPSLVQQWIGYYECRFNWRFSRFFRLFVLSWCIGDRSLLVSNNADGNYYYLLSNRCHTIRYTKTVFRTVLQTSHNSCHNWLILCIFLYFLFFKSLPLKIWMILPVVTNNLLSLFWALLNQVGSERNCQST